MANDTAEKVSALHFAAENNTAGCGGSALITADLNLLEMHVNFIVTSDLYPTTKSSTGWRN